MKILVISLAGIGDTLFATPLIHELRTNFRNAVIDALVLWRGSRDLLEGNPHLNTVYQHNLIAEPKAATLKFLWKLRTRRYDVSLNTHPQSRVHYRIVARFINAHMRISHDYDHTGLLDRFLVNRRLAQDYSRHAIENNLSFLPFLGVKPVLAQHRYELFLADAEREWATEFIAQNNLSGRLLLGIHVGSGGTKNLALRRWPLENFAELIRQLTRVHPRLSVLPFGGPEEEADHARLLAETDANRVMQPRTQNLRQAAALLKHCDAFLSVDTALMHLAAAMQVPHQVVIETPTWNKPIEPYGHPFILVKNPAVAGRNLDFYRYDGRGMKGSDEELRRCMASVSVESVLKTLQQALESKR